jgi:hypothetical protein
LSGVVGQPQSKLAVDLGLVACVGVGDDLSDAGQRGDDVLDLVSAQPPVVAAALAQPGLGEGSLGPDLGDPFADDGGIGAGVERGAVVGELASQWERIWVSGAASAVTVVVLHYSANRDGALLAEPDRLDVTRTGHTPHLAFGHGIHHCIGAPLVLLRWFVTFELVESFAVMAGSRLRLSLTAPG